MAAAMTFYGTNAVATNTFAINWAVSLDGTNYQTANPLQTSALANGTNYVSGYTNFASALLNNALFITPYSLVNSTTNAAGGITISNITVSFGNIVPGGYP
jgi:hypothetical protein